MKTARCMIKRKKTRKLVGLKRSIKTNDRHTGRTLGDGHSTNPTRWPPSTRTSRVSCQFKFSVRFTRKEFYHLPLYQPMLQGPKTKVQTFPTSVPNSCNSALALNLLPVLSLKFRLPPDQITLLIHRILFPQSTNLHRNHSPQGYPQFSDIYPQFDPQLLGIFHRPSCKYTSVSHRILSVSSSQICSLEVIDIFL